MWARVEGASIKEIIPRPKAMIIGDIQYPQNIFSLWAAANLKGIGIYPITMDKTNLKNGRYYSNTEITYTWDSENETVTGAYGTAIAQDLDDLKTAKKVEVNNNAGGALSDYDWYTLRASSGGAAIPSAVATYQAAVRTKSNSMCTQIDGAADVDALAALYVYNEDDPPTRPLGEWPSKPE